ncbi:MAG: hypothetical protein WCQ21_36415 [Verrucomicrobiota bacterium]
MGATSTGWTSANRLTRTSTTSAPRTRRNSSRGKKFFDISDTNSAGYRLPAHVLFYLAVRYTGDLSKEPALYLTEATVPITSTTKLGRTW